MLILLGARENKTLLGFYNYVSSRYSVKIAWLDHYQLINEISVHDTIHTCGKTNISWRYKDDEFTSGNVLGVLNDLRSLESGLFQDFAPEDRKYAQEEFFAYLLSALSALPNVANRPSQGGLSGFTRTLPYQWATARKLCPSVGIPKYYLGRMSDAECRKFDPEYTVISDKLYDYGNWTPASRPIAEGELALTYEIPSGSACIASYVGGKIYCFRLTNREGFAASDKILHFVKLLAEHFCLTICQVLFFADGASGHITFGAIRPHLDIGDCADIHVCALYASMASEVLPYAY